MDEIDKEWPEVRKRMDKAFYAVSDMYFHLCLHIDKLENHRSEPGVPEAIDRLNKTLDRAKLYCGYGEYHSKGGEAHAT